MKRLLGILIATLMILISPASMSQTGNARKPTATVTQQRIAIQSAHHIVKSPRIPRFKVLRSNPHRYSKIVIDDLDYEIDDDGLISPYRRRDLNKIEHEEGISDRVRWRLFLARQAALLVHRSKFG